MRLRRTDQVFRAPAALVLAFCAYLIWSMVPIAVAVRVAFSRFHLAEFPAGFSTRWFSRVLHNPDLVHSFEQSFLLAFITVGAAVPMGAGIALALHHLRGRRSIAASGVLVLAIATPQIAIAVSLSLMYTYLFRFVGFTTPAQALAHVTLALPFVVLIVRGRLSTIPAELEEVAMDLGASPREAVRRVLLPLLTPAFAASAAVAFLLSFDNIVLSDLLCIPNGCRTVPMQLFAARGAIEATPDLFAAGVASSVVTLAIAIAVFVVLQRFRALPERRTR